VSDDTDKRALGGDTPTTPRHTPEATRAPRRRPPVDHLDSPATRDALCELLGVTPRTIQRRIHAGDITREEGADRPWYSLHDSKWTRTQLARSGWKSTPRGDIVGGDVATGADTPGDTQSRPPWKAAHEELAALLEDTRADLEDMRAEVAETARASKPIPEDTGGDSGPSERDGDDRRPDTLTGWRAVCMAILVRLKLLLDAIMRVVRGEGV